MRTSLCDDSTFGLALGLELGLGLGLGLGVRVWIRVRVYEERLRSPTISEVSDRRHIRNLRRRHLA